MVGVCNAGVLPLYQWIALLLLVIFLTGQNVFIRRCCFQTEVLNHSSCAGAEERSENCPVVTTEQWLCLQRLLINKAKAARSAVWAPSSPSCFQKQGGQPH